MQQQLKANQIKNSRGMTLIELSVVMLLIMMAASLTLPLFTGIAQSTRNQITEARVTQIKQAIVNVQTVNGTPTVSGFVADVGRLPGCIRELIDGYCEVSGAPSCSPYVTLANQALTTPVYCTPHNTSNITKDIRWNGPYLTTSGGTFFDGWGNQDAGDGNFGWSFNLHSRVYTSLPPTTSTPVCSTVSNGNGNGLCDTLTLQSYGADGIGDLAGGSTVGYDADYPLNTGGLLATIPVSIQPSDWIIDLYTAGLNVQFNHLSLAAAADMPPLTSPMVSTACASGAVVTSITSNISLTANTVTTSCSLGTSATSTIICPAGYALTTTTPTSTSTTITCTPPLPTTASPTVAVNCLNSWTLTVSTPVSLSITVTCTGTAQLTPVTNTITSLSLACASGVPVTPLILANDLYGNSIIPITPTPPLATTYSLPSNSCQSSLTVNYGDYANFVASTSAPYTPMAIGNWNVCAFLSSGGVVPAPTAPTWVTGADFPQSFTSSITPTCSNTYPNPNIIAANLSLQLSSSAPLYNGTIAVLPRTQPSVAW